MNQTKFKGRDISVTLSTSNPAKRQATNITNPTERSSASHSPDPQPSNTENKPTEEPSTKTLGEKPSKKDIEFRTIALLNVPDTINDSRIRALAEPYGPIVKIVLRPDHRGAIVEFKDVNDAGKAALGLDGHEITLGRKLSIGTVAEMLKQEPETKVDRISADGGKGKKKQAEQRQTATTLQPTGPIKRPTQPGTRRGGRGGLGLKRGGVGLSSSRVGFNAGQDVKDVEMNGNTEGQVKAKSNADFKAMFLKEKS